jgi:hypothetical protein
VAAAPEGVMGVGFAKRVVLFLVTNLAVVLVLAVAMRFFGCHPPCKSRWLWSSKRTRTGAAPLHTTSLKEALLGR